MLITVEPGIHAPLDLRTIRVRVRAIFLVRYGAVRVFQNFMVLEPTFWLADPWSKLYLEFQLFN